MPLHPDSPSVLRDIPSPCMSSATGRRHGIPSFCAMSDAHAVTPRNPPLRASLHRACLRRPDEARDSQLLCYERMHMPLHPGLPPLRTSLHRACLRDRTRHGIPSFSAMSDAHAVTPRRLRFEHPFTVHVWATGRGTGFPASLL